MRNDILKIIAESAPQGRDEWKAFRQGKFTGSQVGRLMKSGRGKDEVFGKDALSYIKDVASLRTENRLAVVGDYEQYCYINDAHGRNIDWGHEQEDNAIAQYKFFTGRNVTQCGSILHQEIDCFADSPDGLVLDLNGCIEIKCSMRLTHEEYINDVDNQDDLLKFKPEYYWQCMSHMAVTGAAWCDFLSYYPFDSLPLWIVTVERDEDAIANLLERIKLADALAEERVNEKKRKKIALQKKLEIIKKLQNQR